MLILKNLKILNIIGKTCKSPQIPVLTLGLCPSSLPFCQSECVCVIYMCVHTYITHTHHYTHICIYIHI